MHGWMKTTQKRRCMLKVLLELKEARQKGHKPHLSYKKLILQGEICFMTIVEYRQKSAHKNHDREVEE